MKVLFLGWRSCLYHAKEVFPYVCSDATGLVPFKGVDEVITFACSLGGGCQSLSLCAATKVLLKSFLLGCQNSSLTWGKKDKYDECKEAMKDQYE